MNHVKEKSSESQHRSLQFVLIGVALLMIASLVLPLVNGFKRNGEAQENEALVKEYAERLTETPVSYMGEDVTADDFSMRLQEYGKSPSVVERFSPSYYAVGLFVFLIGVLILVILLKRASRWQDNGYNAEDGI